MTGKQAGSLPGVQYPKHHYYIEPNKLKNILQQFFDKPNQFCTIHLMYDPIAAEIVQDNHYATFFIYRDPRDQIISFLFRSQTVCGQLQQEFRWMK